MDLIEKATILHYHKYSGIDNCNDIEKDVDLHNANSLIRYSVLSKIANLSNSSVLDAGCGTGKLLDYLDQQYFGIKYTGLDINGDFVKEASKVYKYRGNCNFYQCDFSKVLIPQYDYVFASESLSYKVTDSLYHVKTIERLFHIAQKAFAFNMLDNGFGDHSLLKGYNKDDIIRYCKMLCNRVECIDNYLDNDFTIIMYKD